MQFRSVPHKGHWKANIYNQFISYYETSKPSKVNYWIFSTHVAHFLLTKLMNWFVCYEEKVLILSSNYQSLQTKWIPKLSFFISWIVYWGVLCVSFKVKNCVMLRKVKGLKDKSLKGCLWIWKRYNDWGMSLVMKTTYKISKCALSFCILLVHFICGKGLYCSIFFP